MEIIQVPSLFIIWMSKRRLFMHIISNMRSKFTVVGTKIFVRGQKSVSTCQVGSKYHG